MYNELYHHGILGQKWGKRNGPPYPLGTSDHSASERRAGWKMSLDKKAKERYNKNRDKNSEDEPEKKKFRLTDKQKRAIKIGAAVTASALAAYGIYKLGKSGKLNELADKGREFIGKNFGKELKVGSIDPKSVPKFKMLEKPDSINEVLRKTNPTGAHNNCFNCVVAATARLCGLDVTARGDRSDGRGISFDEICKVFKLDPDNPKDVVRMINPSVDKITRQIEKRFKEGDVGAIGVAWNERYARDNKLSEPGGHTLNWIIRNGKTEFIDCQCGLSDNAMHDLISKYIDSGKEASIAKFTNIAEKLNFTNNFDTEQFNKFVR